MADREIIVIATATKANRTAELTVQRVGDNVDWFIIVNYHDDNDLSPLESLCSN